MWEVVLAIGSLLLIQVTIANETDRLERLRGVSYRAHSMYNASRLKMADIAIDDSAIKQAADVLVCQTIDLYSRSSNE
jgi:hypothetical protein